MKKTWKQCLTPAEKEQVYKCEKELASLNKHNQRKQEVQGVLAAIRNRALQRLRYTAKGAKS